MAEAQSGDTVKVHYTGRLADGTVFDTSRDGEPLEFKVGEGEIIEGFEQAVVGMSPAESRTVTIIADKAYGPYRSEMVMEVAREELPEEFEPEVGQLLQMRQGSNAVAVTVTDVSDGSVTIDANHPLAGEDLIFEIELVEIAA